MQGTKYFTFLTAALLTLWHTQLSEVIPPCVVPSSSQGSMRGGGTGLCNQNAMTPDGLNSTFIPQPASKQGIHTEARSCLKGGLFALGGDVFPRSQHGEGVSRQPLI